METKICRKCGEEKCITEYHFRKDSSKYRNECKTCLSEINKVYRALNLEKLRKKERERNRNKKISCESKKIVYSEEEKLYRKNLSKEKTKITVKKYAEENYDKLKAYRQKWEKDNRDKRNKQRRERISNNPLLRLTEGIRNSIKNSIKNKGYTKKSRTYKILCCSFEEFKDYIESKFETWMNWDNKGRYNGEFNYGWDVDHIIPISSAKTEEEIISLNHYTNFQPLCSKVNREIKKDNY